MTMTNAEIIQAANQLRAEYAAFAAEERACGHEVISFEEWAGTAPDPRDGYIAEWQKRYDEDTIDLY